MFILPLWTWIVLGAIIIVVVGAVLYFVVFASKSSNKLFASLTVVDLDGGTDVSIIHPGDRLRLTVTGTHVGSINWYISSDKGASYTQIGSGLPKDIIYTLPPDLFSQQCMVKVSDSIKGNEFITSNVFGVGPILSVTGPGAQEGSQAVIGTTVTFKIVTDAWNLLSKNSNFHMELKVHGTAQWSQQQLKTTIDANKSSFTWLVGADLLDSAVDIQFKTTTLVSQGYPHELVFVLPYPISILAHETTARVSGAFNSFEILDIDHNLPLVLHPLDWIQYTWGTDTTVSRVDLSYGISKDGPFQLVIQGIDATRQTYKFQIPQTIESSTSVFFRIQDSSDASNNAVAPAVQVVSNWVMIDDPKISSKVVCYSTQWTLVVPVKINGFNLNYGDPDNWKTELHFANSVWDLSTISENYTLQIMPTDSSQNLYVFMYVFLVQPPPLVTFASKPFTLLQLEQYALDFQVGLSFKGSPEQLKAGHYNAVFPSPYTGPINGKPFTNIMYYPNFDPVNWAAQTPAELPATLTSGETYYFVYVGSQGNSFTQAQTLQVSQSPWISWLANQVFKTLLRIRIEY